MFRVHLALALAHAQRTTRPHTRPHTEAQTKTRVNGFEGEKQNTCFDFFL